jgi:predicted RNA-binding protein with PIN domain
LERERSRSARAETASARATARADALEAELQRFRNAAASASAAAAAAAAEQVERQPAGGMSRRGGGRRARPRLPAGLLVDSVSGADAMLRGPSVLLVVDGYNVSKTGWPDASLEIERESLLSALHGLHLTSGTDVVVAFDGDGTQSFSKKGRHGVRVVFSAPGEEADSVVVELVSKAPLQTRIVVASSDRWVREHAETFGAVVISAATLVAVLRKAPGRSGG